MLLKTYLDERPGEGMRLARALDVSSSNVYTWASGARDVPIRHCAQIERLTAGQVMRWDLRPEDWRQVWPELEGHPAAPKRAA